MICFQSGGSFQSSSNGCHSRGFGRPRYFEILGQRAVAVRAFAELDRRIHPVSWRRLIFDLYELFGFRVGHGSAPFERQSGRLDLVVELVFPLLVGVDLHRVIPGVDVPLHAVVVGQVARGAQEDAAHVHQLAEGK